MKYLALASALTVLGFTACTETKDADLQHPEIELESPANWQAFSVSEGIHFEAHLHDDQGLSQYNITIHDNFEGHEHGARLKSQKIRFDFTQSYDADGAETEGMQHIDLPAETAAGPYHLIVNAVDVNSNSTSFDDGSTKEVNIIITNESMPQVNLSMDGDELDGSPGQVLAVNGSITDNEGLFDEVTVMVGHEEEEEDHEGHDHARLAADDHLYEETFELTATNQLELSELLSNRPIQIPSDISEEHLMLTISVYDDQGNISISRTPVHLAAN